MTTHKPKTPRQALIEQLLQQPEAVQREAFARIDDLAPRGPDDDDKYGNSGTLILEVSDDGDEQPIGAGPPVDEEESPQETQETPLQRLDRWSPDFQYPSNLRQHVRIDSRTFLLGNERYIFKPLAALDAASMADETSSAPFGKALIGFAITCRKLWQEAREQFTVDDVVDEEASYEAFVRYVHAAWENLIAEAGPTFKPFTWAWNWIKICDVRRVPLPSNGAKPPDQRDKGGPILDIKGSGSWDMYYRGREHHLIRVAAAAAWGSLGPFLTFLQITRD